MLAQMLGDALRASRPHDHPAGAAYRGVPV